MKCSSQQRGLWEGILQQKGVTASGEKLLCSKQLNTASRNRQTEDKPSPNNAAGSGSGSGYIHRRSQPMAINATEQGERKKLFLY